MVDPAFFGTTTESCLRELARRYEIPFQWHCGFRLSVAAVPDDFRGPAMPRLARRISGDGVLDAGIIGVAAASLCKQPDAWQDWGTTAETSQHLKQLCHVLVHYGGPAIHERA